MDYDIVYLTSNADWSKLVIQPEKLRIFFTCSSTKQTNLLNVAHSPFCTVCHLQFLFCLWTKQFEHVGCQWIVCVHRLDLSLYSHPKEFWGNGVRTHVISQVKKILSTRKIFLRGGSNPGRCIKQDSEPDTLPASYSGPVSILCS